MSNGAQAVQAQFPRHFIDITTSLYLIGQPPIGILRAEREVNRRLLNDPRLTAIPVAFWSDQMFVVEWEDANLALRSDRPPLATISTVPLSTRVEQLSDGPALAKTSPGPLGARVHQKRDGPALGKIAAGPEGVNAGSLSYVKRGIRALGFKLIQMAPSRSRDDLRLTIIFALRFLRSILTRGTKHGLDLSPLDDLRNRILTQLTVVARPTDRDVLWTCGSCMPLRWLAEQKRLHHFRVAATGHDIIRVRYPEWNPPEMPRDLFVAQTIDLIDAADVIYCPSEYSRLDIAKFAVEAKRPAPRIELVRWGADLPRPSMQDAAEREVPELIGRRFALAVGTVEARKNYGVLLHAWHVLATEPNFDLDLVIVGRPGVGAAASIAELRTSPLLGKRLFWLEDCPDSTLSGLYSRCSLVLYPSLMEGWGLPVTEGLAHGKRVVCSNRGALPEAAMGAAIVLDATDDAAWVDVIRSEAKNSNGPRPVMDLPTWDAAADCISRGLVALTSKASGSRDA